MSTVTPRRRARELVLQGLYERQLSGSSDDVIAESLTTSPGYARADAAYFAELWRGVTSGYPALLDTLAPDVDRKIESLSPIERAVLVIGAWELSHRLDIPYRVVINEAVEIAKSYGGTDGHKFVNGVLDKLAPRLRVGEIRASGKP
ncbi:MAG: transcription antitermination factor NusB [Pseudomonadota bacterium]|nr:transcription antitermination factor NusB [Pseudomonadota bacterium]